MAALLLLLAASATAQAVPGGPAPPDPSGPVLLCASAGELGLAGAEPLLAFYAHDGSGWRPVEAYVEPLEVTFVPAISNASAGVLERLSSRGQIQPARLLPETRLCFRAWPGVPGRMPDGPGILAVLEREGRRYHVFAADLRAGYFGSPPPLWPMRVEAPTARVLEARRIFGAAGTRGAREAVHGVEPLQAGSTLSMSYLAAFPLARLATLLVPGMCASTEFEVPRETSAVTLYFAPGTTRGTYNFTVWRNGTRYASGTVRLYWDVSLPSRIAALAGGRWRYRVRICDVDPIAAGRTAVSAVVEVRGQRAIWRSDRIMTREVYISSRAPYNATFGSKLYFYLPGFDVDAAYFDPSAYASGVTVHVYAAFPADAVEKDSTGPYLDVYWGPLYLGRIYGSSSGSSAVFSGSVDVSSSLLYIYAITRGLGGVISVGPLKYRWPLSTLRIDMSIFRPVDLADADSWMYQDYYTRRFRAEASYHSWFADVLKAFKATVDIYRSANGFYGVLYVAPYQVPGWLVDNSYYGITFKFRALDELGNPAQFAVASGSAELYTPASAGVYARYLEVTSQTLKWVEFLKGMADALRRAASGFPIIGYATILLDNIVNTLAEKATVWTEDNGYVLAMRIYTGATGTAPIASQKIGFAMGGAGTIYLDSVLIDFGPTTYRVWPPAVNVPQYPGPEGSLYLRPASASFLNRTLTCGYQERGLYGRSLSGGLIPTASVWHCNPGN